MRTVLVNARGYGGFNSALVLCGRPDVSASGRLDSLLTSSAGRRAVPIRR